MGSGGSREEGSTARKGAAPRPPGTAEKTRAQQVVRAVASEMRVSKAWAPGGLEVRSRALKGFTKGSGGCTGLNSVHPLQIHVHLDPQKVNLFGNKTFLDGIQSRMLV